MDLVCRGRFIPEDVSFSCHWNHQALKKLLWWDHSWWCKRLAGVWTSVNNSASTNRSPNCCKLFFLCLSFPQGNIAAPENPIVFAFFQGVSAWTLLPCCYSVLFFNLQLHGVTETWCSGFFFVNLWLGATCFKIGQETRTICRISFALFKPVEILYGSLILSFSGKLGLHRFIKDGVWHGKRKLSRWQQFLEGTICVAKL